LPDDASVKLIGLGGVGSIVARYGAMFLASLGRPARLVLIDGDAFEPGNASRMFFGRCGNKAAVVCDELLPRFADSPLALIAIEEYVTPANLDRLLHDGDIVLLAVDNHATRKLVSEHCAARLRDVCLISGGNDGLGQDSAGQPRRGTFGNVQVYVRRDGADVTPPLTRFHPEIAQPADRLPTEKGCTELVASVPQILFANLAVASALLNTLWLHLCGALHYGELAFDIADGLMQPVELPLAAPAPRARTGRRNAARPRHRRPQTRAADRGPA
jgi:hypothetical protein